MRILENDQNLVDVRPYNEKMEELYYDILQYAPLKPSKQHLWGKGMKYLNSDQDQVLNIVLEWSPGLVDGGFEIEVGINSLGDVAKQITKPPKVRCKIITFLNSNNKQSFDIASKQLSELFGYAEKIKDTISKIF